MELNIKDADGQWFVNTGSFRFVDPTTGIAFEPHVPTKVRPTEWLELQKAVIKATDDPTAPAPTEDAPAPTGKKK